MFPPRYTVLSLFESRQGYLAEIARMTGRSSRPRHEWIWIEPRHALTLQPLTVDGDGHGFREGRLRRDESRAEFRWASGQIAELRALPPDSLPQPVRGFLELHLS